MPTLISNQNYAVRWDKTDCHEYTITNLSELYNANVTVTDKTGTWTESFVLAPEGSNSITVPGDGVFEVCAYLYDMPIELEVQQRVNGYLSVVSFPDDNQTVLLHADFTPAAGGPPVNVNPTNRSLTVPSDAALFVADLQAWLDLNGGGTVTLLAPGETIPGVYVPADPTFYCLVVQASTQYLTTVTYENGGEPITNDSNLSSCSNAYEIQTDSQIIFSLTIGGTEVVPADTGWDMSTQEGADAAIAAINTFLGANGYADGGIYELNIFVENCAEVILTTGIYGPGPTECDFIYEFCDMYACLSRLMNRWMCADPCADKCTAAGETYEEARRKAIELSTMFFHALMPLVSVDRLWYLGNWSITDQRICNVNNILELFTKMRDYVSNCGFDCGCGCADPCDDCDPCAGQSYQPSLSNPTTPCGCK